MSATSIYPLSFSRMQVYEQCPMRFEGQYITKKYRDQGNDASRYGTRVHEAFEAHAVSHAPLSQDLQQYSPALMKLEAVPGEKHYELNMAVRANKTPCGWDDKDCAYRGAADVVVIDGTVGVGIDWKTGKPKEDTQQLMLMAAMMFEHFPVLETVRTKYVWLKYLAAPSPIGIYTRGELPWMWAHFDARAKQMEDSLEQGVFKAHPSGLCPWCPLYSTCSYARRRR